MLKVGKRTLNLKEYDSIALEKGVKPPRKDLAVFKLSAIIIGSPESQITMYFSSKNSEVLEAFASIVKSNLCIPCHNPLTQNPVKPGRSNRRLPTRKNGNSSSSEEENDGKVDSTKDLDESVADDKQEQATKIIRRINDFPEGGAKSAPENKLKFNFEYENSRRTRSLGPRIKEIIEKLRPKTSSKNTIVPDCPPIKEKVQAFDKVKQ
jgi:hypothetical protein